MSQSVGTHMKGGNENISLHQEIKYQVEEISFMQIQYVLITHANMTPIT